MDVNTLLLLISSVFLAAGITEVERVDQLTVPWPPQYDYNIETEAYMQSVAVTESEIMEIPALDERWQSWVQLLQGLKVAQFHRTGYIVIDTPLAVHEPLISLLRTELEDLDALRDEGPVPDNFMTLPNKMINVPSDMQMDIMNALKKDMSEFIGEEVVHVRTYGLRVYQNGTSLAMHRDKVMNPFGAIIHLDREYASDAQPWALDIEDRLTGDISQVYLQPGQTMLYEGARLLHGRRSPLLGRYYTSFFAFFKPKKFFSWFVSAKDASLDVPPHWYLNCTERFGHRYAGEAITTDRYTPYGAPKRDPSNPVKENKHYSMYPIPKEIHIDLNANVLDEL